METVLTPPTGTSITMLTAIFSPLTSGEHERQYRSGPQADPRVGLRGAAAGGASGHGSAPIAWRGVLQPVYRPTEAAHGLGHDSGVPQNPTVSGGHSVVVY